MKRIILIILSVMLILSALYYAGKRFFPFNRFFGALVIPENILLSGSYSNSGTTNSLLCNFEIDDHGKIPKGFYKGLAHSGQFSAKAFGKNTYSLAIEQTAGQMGIDRMKSIAVSAWIFVFPSDHIPDGVLVLSVTNAYGISKVWHGVYMKGQDVPIGKWFRMSGLFDLSDVKLQPGYKVHIYFWNRSRTDILVDDYYIVLGGQKERRGESPLADMTKNPVFNPRVNYPPFETFFAEREETGNGYTASLIPGKTEKEGIIFPDDRILSGNFLETGSRTDAILAISLSGIPEMYSFCAGSGSFKRIAVIVPPDAMPFFRSREILKGRFTENTFDQLLLVGDHGIITGTFSPMKDVCQNAKTISSEFKVTWKSDEAFDAPGNILKDSQVIAGDIDGDGFTELLVVGKDGSWKILGFQAGKSLWKLIASGTGTKSPFQDPLNGKMKITIGRFLPGYVQDLLLIMKGNQSGKSCTSSLLKFDKSHGTFISANEKSNDGTLKIIGLDTLKPADQFIFGDFGGNKKPGILRYNRDWRYDLKELTFGENDFTIRGNIDFHGYEKDHNPKYYGILRIIAGRFIDPSRTSLLVIGRNCKNFDVSSGTCKEYQELPELPDFISVYSLQIPISPQ